MIGRPTRSGTSFPGLVRLTLTMIALLAACTRGIDRPAPEKEVEKGVAAKIDRICKLPTRERDAELEKLEKESGFVLYCGDASEELY